MKRLLSALRDKGKRLYLALFLSMIIPSALSYYAAEIKNFPLMFLFLGLVVLANILTLI
jgi:hypothetical protein